MKRKLASHSGFFNCRGIAAWLNFSATVPVVLYAFGVFSAASAFAQAVIQKQNPGNSAVFQARAIEHTAQGGAAPAGQAMNSIYPQASNEDIAGSGVAPSLVGMAPTRSSFLANWNIASGATGYRLDVSTTGSFDSYVNGYQDLDVGNVTSRIVSGLSPGTKYYYRVRASNALGAISDSNVMTATTATTSGLVITPTFDSSILNNPNSAAIQSMINQAIAIYQSLFSDPMTVTILFRYSNTLPNGTTMGTALARSNLVVYPIPWNTYINALNADAKTGNDATANASLPANPLSTNVVPSSAGGRAIGLNTPPAMFANGTVAPGGPYDGIVTLNSSQPFQFNRPPSGSNYDALRSTEHEIDEVLGLGSHLGAMPPSSDLRPQDLFGWAAPATRNLTSTGSRYFSINSGNSNIVSFNQDSGGDFGDWLSPSCPQANPYVQNAFSCTGQLSDVTASSPEGINLDVIGYDLGSPNPPPTILANISTRLLVETGNNVLIGGFIITGTQPKKVIVRALGPSLPLAGVLADPVLELHGPGTFATITNDNWRSDQEAEIIATGIPPTNDLESAIVATLPANNSAYTAIVRGVNNSTGIGVVEAYDLDQTVDSKLGNIATRGLVQTGDNVLIAGTIVLGQTSQNVIVLALGPSLGVPGQLADPTLELRDVNGGLIASNDNWRSDQEAEIIATGIPPSNDLESAIVATLPANGASYTAIVRGVNGTTGVAVVEVFALN
jgi:hypothetical protein